MVWVFFLTSIIHVSCSGDSCQQVGVHRATLPQRPSAWHLRDHLQLGQKQATRLLGCIFHHASDTLQQLHTDLPTLKMDPPRPVAAATAPLPASLKTQQLILPFGNAARPSQGTTTPRFRRLAATTQHRAQPTRPSAARRGAAEGDADPPPREERDAAGLRGRRRRSPGEERGEISTGKARNRGTRPAAGKGGEGGIGT